jgi:hypothetical protein
MLYMLLICYDPTQPADGHNRQPEHAKLEAELRAEGTYVSGAGLWPQWKDVGRAARSDGPFAETKEAVGGYFMVECDEERAVAIAARIAVDGRSWIRVQAVGLFHPHGEREAQLKDYLDPRVIAMWSKSKAGSSGGGA